MKVLSIGLENYIKMRHRVTVTVKERYQNAVSFCERDRKSRFTIVVTSYIYINL